MSDPRIPFIIAAKCPDGPRAKASADRGSAIVLADRWINEGCGDVLIADQSGVVHDREDLRSSLLKEDPLGLGVPDES
jgi:hypothetical protein